MSGILPAFASFVLMSQAEVQQRLEVHDKMTTFPAELH